MFARLITLFKKFFHSVPNDKILDWSIIKAFADNEVNMTEKLKFLLHLLKTMAL